MKKLKSFINEATFWRINKKDIDKLYISLTSFKSMYENVKNGNDLQIDSLNRIIKNLQDIKKNAKQFNVGTRQVDVPKEYQ